MCGRDQLWLNDIVSQYEVRYIKAADALMRELASIFIFEHIMGRYMVTGVQKESAGECKNGYIIVKAMEQEYDAQ